MHREHERLHQSLAVLSPPRRFQLLMLLLSGVDRSVSQLARAVRLSQSCTTRHLQSLERAGLVKGTRDGKRVVFRPAPRDEAARGVLASLARSDEDAVFRAGLAMDAIPVASTAERDQLVESGGNESPKRRRGRRAAHERLARFVRGELHGQEPGVQADAPGALAAQVRLTIEPPLPHEPPESGNRFESPEPPRRFASDIEDYLL